MFSFGCLVLKDNHFHPRQTFTLESLARLYPASAMQASPPKMNLHAPNRSLKKCFWVKLVPGSEEVGDHWSILIFSSSWSYFVSDLEVCLGPVSSWCCHLHVSQQDGALRPASFLLFSWQWSLWPNRSVLVSLDRRTRVQKWTPLSPWAVVNCNVVLLSWL